ncbi:MAG TPA: hypothetical protein VD838_03780 [Anaeromyxobacteraceae bacterium]|nr:hypothetical protein [Anaeromyxobacteraceae bacterium]
MTPKELQDIDPDLDALDDEDERWEQSVDGGDWDEETLGLDWSDADEQSLVDEVIRLR